MNTQSLLLELGTEELPPKALPVLAEAFANGVSEGLAKRGIQFGVSRCLYSPRRLAVLLEAVTTEQPTQSSEVFGPYANIALDAHGEATPALRAFAQKNNVSVEQLQKTTDAKGERFVARSTRAGSLTIELLPEIVNEAVKALPIPKPMRWGDRSEQFVRPVHWLVALFGSAVVPMTVLGLKSGRASRGHRFHAPEAFDVASPETYIAALSARKVLVDATERKAKIAQQIETAAASVGKRAEIPAELLDEVNCLVEWPAPILCQFESAFLRVPHEALVSTMQANQKFFALRNSDGALSEYFVGIANIDSKDPAQIKQGYERVIRPRFADAAFFFDEDLKQGLASMADGLASVTYQKQLGSYADKTARVAALAAHIAGELGLDAAQARRAAALSKADLQSRLVGEFPELQGTAGRYYAKAAGESDAVGEAIEQAYQPRFAGDGIAASQLGQVLAIAERLDTLAGGFAAKMQPTGNKDPFALRRNALGLARTILEANIDFDLVSQIEIAVELVNKSIHAAVQKDGGGHGMLIGIKDFPLWNRKANQDIEPIHDFIIERLRAYFTEQGLSSQQFDVVATQKPASLLDFSHRLNATAEFAKLPEAAALAAANKRIGNILKKSGSEAAKAVSENLLQEQAEKDLWQAVQTVAQSNSAKLAARDYVSVLQALAELRAPVDAFFDGVMVNAEDLQVRGNRLALLENLAAQFNAVGDISLLA